MLTFASAALAAGRSAVVGAASPEARFTRGLELARTGQPGAAIRILAALSQEYPRLPEPHIQLAALYVRQGRYPNAAAELKAALAIEVDEALGLATDSPR